MLPALTSGPLDMRVHEGHRSVFLFPLPPAKGSSLCINCYSWWFPCSASGKLPEKPQLDCVHWPLGDRAICPDFRAITQALEFFPGLLISVKSNVLQEGKASMDLGDESNQSKPITGFSLFLLVTVPGTAWPVSCIPPSGRKCLEEV